MKMKSKNNWTMRAAVLMFALVLITSSFVGGTFAKYVTSGAGGASARVAKFGVTIAADSHSMFKKTYATDDTTNHGTITNSVDADTTETEKNLVAPGTAEADMMHFSLKGTPEVAVNVKVEVSGTDVFLKQGTYKDITTATNDADDFILKKDYYPVVFTLKKGTEVKAKGTIADLNNYFNTLSKDYDPNTNLTDTFGDYTISWEWVYHKDDDPATSTPSLTDKADTLLGNLAAEIYDGTGLSSMDGRPALPGSTTIQRYNTALHFTIEATVTQID